MPDEKKRGKPDVLQRIRRNGTSVLDRILNKCNHDPYEKRANFLKL
jgi:hypothetical protein